MEPPENKPSPTILVTGGKGLLGSYLLQELSRQGMATRALYRGQPPAASPGKPIEWVPADILDIGALEEAMQGITEVYHCAAIVSFHPRRKTEMRRINVEGTANVVNAALRHGVRKLVHVSSVSALGRKRDGQCIREDVQWDDEANLSAYGLTKHLAELEVRRGIAEGLEAVMVNPSIILGVGDWNRGSAALFRNAWNEFPWYTDGSTGLVDAADVADAMIRLMKSPIHSERFILSAENWPYRKVFSTMAAAMGKKAPHRRASPWISSWVWRWEAVKSLFSSQDPLLTRETAETAQMQVSYDPAKILSHLPGFRFRPLEDVIRDYAYQYSVKMGRP
ncbi:MAG: NAD-dependent epimerase/dehydratase family protein [Bacteroidetes bacterium]|nr:NAD-dependent epimerase/dehydratase family protein [Bacteroidota bacterium]